LETLELARFLSARDSVSAAQGGALVGLSGSAVEEPRPSSDCQRSKIILQITSASLCYRKWCAGFKKKVEARGPVPELGSSRTRPACVMISRLPLRWPTGTSEAAAADLVVPTFTENVKVGQPPAPV